MLCNVFVAPPGFHSLLLVAKCSDGTMENVHVHIHWNTYTYTMEKGRKCYAGGGSMKLVPLLHSLLQSAVHPLSLMEHIQTNYGKRRVNGNLLFIPSYAQAGTKHIQGSGKKNHRMMLTVCNPFSLCNSRTCSPSL